MFKTKDGVAVLLGTSYNGSPEYLLRASGGSTRDGTPTIINGTTNLVDLVAVSAVINGTLQADSTTIGNLIVQGASSLGVATVTTINNYTLGDACARMVDSSIPANSTSLNLPTSKAVEDRINTHKGIDKEGTVINVTQGTGISITGTTSVNPTIAIASDYRDYITHGEAAYNALKLSQADVDGVIDRWDEVTDFLNGITDTSTLNGILGQFTKNGADVSLQPVHTHIATTWPTGTANTTDKTTGAGHSTHPESNAPEAKYLLSGNGLLKNLGSGSYILQVIHSTDSDGAIYTGYFSYTTGSGTDEEIILHRSGNSPSANNFHQRIYAKIKYIENATYLLLAARVEETDCTELTINIKKLL